VESRRWCGGRDSEIMTSNRGVAAVLEGSSSTMTRRRWPPWAPTLSPVLVDGLLAIGLGLLSLSSSISDARRAGTHLPTLGALLLLALMPALWVRRRLPGTALIAVAAIQIGLFALRLQPSANFLAEMVAPYSVALYGSRRVRLATSVGAGLALVAVALPTGLPSSERSDTLALLLAGIGAWMLGATLRGRRAHVAELEDRTARLERERELEASRAVAEERLRIARELHDVVAHNLSVVVVQAQAAQRTLDRDIDRARAVVASIETTGREALDEMRQLLGVLRGGAELELDGEDASSYGPQPGLERLEELVAQVRSAGLAATLRREGTRRQLGPTMDLSAFRIVQEALTNVLKHAGPAKAEVVVRYGEHDLELTVSDDGRGAAAGLDGERGGAPGSGHGLVGMRERVALFDGELTAGPRTGGGYQVRARLPLEVSSS
jgi:signal transduction histidine kinase